MNFGSMVSTLVATGAVFATVAVLFAVMVGVGLGVRRVFVARSERSIATDELPSSFWAGLSVILLLLQVWHLKFPVRLPMTVIVIFCGMGGLLWNRIELLAWLRSRHCKWAVAIILVAAVWVANRSIGPVRAYDSGLYHLSAIRWAREFPIVVGLGNLHGRLAFNNTSLLLDAMLEVGPWAGRSSHLINFLFMLPLLVQIGRSAVAISAAVDSRRAFHAFNLLLLTPLVAMFLQKEFASPNTDMPAALAALAAASLVIDWLTLPAEAPASACAFRLFTIVALAASAVTMKLSLAAFSGSLVVMCLGYFLIAGKKQGVPMMAIARPVLASVLFAAATLGAWGYRGVLLSGYPLYPSATVSAPVEWRVPQKLVDKERDDIRVWGRQYFESHPRERLTGLRWFKTWTASLPRKALYEVVAPTILIGVAGLALLLKRGDKTGSLVPAALLVVGVPAVAAIAFWFVTAPAPRFGSYLFWILAALTVGAALSATRLAGFKLSSVALLIAIVPAALLARQQAMIVWGDKQDASAVAKIFVQPAGDDRGLFGGKPGVAMVPFVTASGLRVNVPVAGDQCWDAQLPCTPYARPQLRTRVAGDLSSGFVLDGVPDR